MYFTFAKNTQAILRMFKFIPDEFVLTFLRLLEKGTDSISEAYALAFSRLQFSIFFFGLSDIQTGTSGQGEVLYMDVSFRRSDMKVD